MKQIKTLTKSALLEMTLGGWLYIIKIFPNLVKINDGKCKPIINHLRGEKNASLTFNKWKDKWYMKDFAQPKYSGDVFDLYAMVNDIDDVKSNFVEILKGIYRDTFGQEPPEKIGFKSVNKIIEESTLPKGVKYEITERKFSELNKFEKEFLEKYDITIDTMKKLDISFLSDYTFIAQNGKTYMISSVEQNIIIGHKFNDCVKIYKPNAKEFKHQIIGTYDREYFVGKKQFDELCQKPSLYNDDLNIVFCAGMKDAMVLTELGYLAISLNSETSNLPDYIYKNIRSLEEQIGKRIIIKILYDNDTTGITQSGYMHGYLFEGCIDSKIIRIPDRIKEKNGKDVSDWISLGFPKQELIDLINDDNIKNDDTIIDESSVSSISSDSYNLEEDDEVTYADVVEEGAKFPTEKPSRLKNLKYEINKRMSSEKKIDLDTKEETEEIEVEIDKVKVHNSNSVLEIPNKVYDNFPDLLKKALSPFDDKDKTMMTLAFITVLGSTLKNVKSKLRNSKFYANLYTIIVAPPASGKSIIKWARALILPIEKSLKSQSNKDFEDYKIRLDKDLKVPQIPNENVFKGNKLLIKKGLDKYLNHKAVSVVSNKNCVFSSTIASIGRSDNFKFNKNIENILFAMATIFNSNLFLYNLLMTSSSFGAGRNRVNFKEFMDMPFVMDDELIKYSKEIHNLHKGNHLKSKDHLIKETEQKIEQKIYKLYNINEVEKELIDYAINVSIPIMKRADRLESLIPNIFQQISKDNIYIIKKYCNIFIGHFSKRFNKSNRFFNIDVYINDDFISLHFIITKERSDIIKFNFNSNIEDTISKIGSLGINNISTNLFVQQDIRGFNKNSFYLIKPNVIKNWHLALAYLDLTEFIEAIAKSEIKNVKQN